MAAGYVTLNFKDGDSTTRTGRFWSLDGTTSGLLVPASVPFGLISCPAKQTFTRPADTTTYALNDLVANSTTAGSVTPLSFTGATISGAGGSGEIVGVVVSKLGTATLVARTHWFTASPTVNQGDNSGLSLASFDQDNYIGFIDVTVNDPVTDTDASGAATGALGVSSPTSLPYTLASTDTLYCLIEAQNLWIPQASDVIAVRPKLRRYG